MVELTGYHGTIKEKADNIIRVGRYILSNKPIEWLGQGVYFFKDRLWAEWWADDVSKRKGGQPAVLRSLICCKEEEFFDLDSIDNRHKMELSLKKLATSKSSMGVPKIKDKRELRRFYCNLYAELMGILVYSCNFPGRGSDRMGFPQTQVQYCVRSNEVIKSNKVLEKENGNE